MEPQDYKWVIIYESESNRFAVTGFVRVNGKWDQDGATLFFTNLMDALGSIYLVEHQTSRTRE